MAKLRQRNRQGGMVGGSLLTGPSGLSGPVSTGRATLLGGELVATNGHLHATLMADVITS